MRPLRYCSPASTQTCAGTIAARSMQGAVLQVHKACDCNNACARSSGEDSAGPGPGSPPAALPALVMAVRVNRCGPLWASEIEQQHHSIVPTQGDRGQECKVGVGRESRERMVVHHASGVNLANACVRGEGGCQEDAIVLGADTGVGGCHTAGTMKARRSSARCGGYP